MRRLNLSIDEAKYTKIKQKANGGGGAKDSFISIFAHHIRTLFLKLFLSY